MPRVAKTVDSNNQDENEDLRSHILSIKQSVDSLSSKFDEKNRLLVRFCPEIALRI